MSSALSIHAAAIEAPDQIAIVTAEKDWTFEEAARETDRAMEFLSRQDRVLTAGGRLPIDGSTRLTGLWLVYAALELGVCLVPIHSRWTAQERHEYLERLGLGQAIDPMSLDDCGYPEPSVDRAAQVREKLHRDSDPESLLAILATSGSTGRPKGVALSRRAFLTSAAANARNLGWQEHDRSLLSLPLAHVGGLSIVIRSLIARRAVVVPPQASRFDAARVLEQIERFKVTQLSVVPTMLRRLLAQGERPGESLRAVLLGGAAASGSLVRRAHERGWPVLPTYGLTEACSQVATERLDSERLDSERQGSGGIGPLMDGVEGRIRDGVLEIRGPMMMNGYVAHESGKDGFLDDGWFRTKDLARFDEQGRLHVLGRADDVIITGGENVSPVEVELALEEHPAVATAAVFSVADPEWGQAVRARVMLNDSGDPVSGEDLKDFLRGELAPFKIPRRIEVVSSLAMTASGKIDRRQLQELIREL